MISVISKFVIENDFNRNVKDALLNRPHIVNDAAGFIDMDVLSPVEHPDEIWLLTRWQNKRAYETWDKSYAYQDPHKFIPKGVKLVRGTAEITVFENVLL